MMFRPTAARMAGASDEGKKQIGRNQNFIAV